MEEDGFNEVKVKFYEMMIEYHAYQDEPWEISQCYFKVKFEMNKTITNNLISYCHHLPQIFDTASTRADPVALQASLESSIIFLLVSKYDNHQMDMLHRIRQLKDLETLPVYASALTHFATKEVIPTPFPGQDIIESHASLGRIGGSEVAVKFVEALRKRVVQHNLRVIAGYYRRIRTGRLADLLGLHPVDLENHLGELASSGDAYVKIDRPAGIVSFAQPRPPAAVLSDWSSDISQLLSLMESTCHLINRENMVHKV